MKKSITLKILILIFSLLMVININLFFTQFKNFDFIFLFITGGCTGSLISDYENGEFDFLK